MRDWLIRLLEAMLRGLHGRSDQPPAERGAEDAPVREALVPRRMVPEPRVISPEVSVCRTIAQFCEAGAAAVDVFAPALENYEGLDPQAGVVITNVDFSGSTIGQVGDALAPAIEKGRQALIEQGLDGYLWQLGFNRRVFALDDAQPLRTLRTARPIRREDFTRQGFVESGTNLSMGLAASIAIGVGHRERGHQGKITVAAWTDGWDFSSTTDRRRCRDALKVARRNCVAIEVRGFCPEYHWGDYQAWKKEVGLRDDEAFVTVLKRGANVQRAVEESIDEHTNSVGKTMMFLAPDSDTPTPPVLA